MNFYPRQKFLLANSLRKNSLKNYLRKMSFKFFKFEKKLKMGCCLKTFPLGLFYQFKFFGFLRYSKISD